MYSLILSILPTHKLTYNSHISSPYFAIQNMSSFNTENSSTNQDTPTETVVTINNNQRSSYVHEPNNQTSYYVGHDYCCRTESDMKTVLCCCCFLFIIIFGSLWITGFI